MKPDHKRIRDIQEYYDCFLASEPGKHSPTAEFTARYSPILQFLAKLGGSNIKVLDIGCGTGMAAEMLGKYAEVYGIDLSTLSIKAAVSNRRIAGGVVGLGEVLPFRAETFDAVVSTEVIEHLLDPLGSLKEINRVLRPGAHLLLSTPNPWNPAVIKGSIIAWVKGERGGSGQIVEELVSPFRLKRLFREASFSLLQHYTVYFRPAWPYRLLGKLSRNLGLYQVCLAHKTAPPPASGA